MRAMVMVVCLSSSMSFVACTASDGDTGGAGPLATINHPGGTIGSESWGPARHLLEGSLTVSSGTLTVAPCSEILMPSGGEISVRDGGALSLIGTAECPILITSVNGATASPGDWDYLEFYDSANGGANVLEHVHISYGGGSSYGSIWVDSGASVEIVHSSVTLGDDVGIMVVAGGEVRNFLDNTLTLNAGGGIVLGANEVGLLGAGQYGPNDVPGILVQHAAVDHDQTWLDLGVPFVAESGFDVQTDTGSAHLTIAAGVSLLVGDSAVISVGNNGGLTLAGTETAPILVDSSKGTPAAGDWSYIEIYSSSVDAYNDFDYAMIAHGGGSTYGAIWVDDEASVAITNCDIYENADFGILAWPGGELRDFTGNALYDNAHGALKLGANSVDDLGIGFYGPNDVNGIMVTDEAVDHDSIWLTLVDDLMVPVPYVAADGFDISTTTGTAVLEVSAGATIALGASATIGVSDNGGLTLAGESANHVTVTSAKGAPAAGDWNEIDVYSGSIDAANVFTYADIGYGGGSSYGQLWLASGAEVTLENVTFTHAGNGCDVDADSGSNLVSLGTNSYDACPQ